MQRKGSITIVGLFIICLTFLSSIFLMYSTTLQVPITYTTLNNIQAKYIAEDKLNKLVYDRDVFDKYLKESILKSFRKKISNKEETIKFKDDPNLNMYFKSAKYYMEDTNNRRNLAMEIRTEYKNISKRVFARINIINELFELGDGLILKKDLLEEDLLKVLALTEELETRIMTYDSFVAASVKETRSLNDLVIIENNLLQRREIYERDFSSHVALETIKNEAIILKLIRKKDQKNSLSIGKLDDNTLINFKGLIYIEGDLIINQNFNFQGVIIVNGGNVIINSVEPAYVEGLIFILDDNDCNLEKLEVVYNRDTVINYGSYLPGFLDPVVKLVQVGN